MPNTHTPNRPATSAADEITDRSYRSIPIDAARAESIDEKRRSVEAVISTENPVPMFDWERFEVVDEVLLADGFQIGGNGRQVPFLDAHTRHSTSNQLGSVRDIRTDPQSRSISARIFFSNAADASSAWTKVREGHLTDVSVGYRILSSVYVRENESQWIAGREFHGPVNVVTQWRLLEVSLVPIGADEQAKLRGLDPQTLPCVGREASRPNNDTTHTAGRDGRASNQEGNLSMPPKLRTICVERGMPADLDDAQALAWLEEHREDLFSPTATDPSSLDANRAAASPVPTADQLARLIEEGAARALEAREAKRAAFRAEVDDLCALADLDESFKARCYDLIDVAAVKKAIIDEKARRATDVVGVPRVTFGAAQRDKHIGGLRSAILIRAAQAIGLGSDQTERFAPAKERAAGYEHYRYASSLDLAAECLRADGFDVRGLSREQIALAAMGWTHEAGLRADPSYHVTGSFSKITQDAINKSMMTAYEEFPSTWRGPMKTGPSVADFKTIHRMQLGAVPNLQVWNDNDNPQTVSFADAEETYAVECRSAKLPFSYKMLVNDDLGVFLSSIFKLSDAAARTVNAVAWAQITGNPTMRDGVALFATASGARKRTNLTSGAGAPSVSTIQTLTNLMMQMRGENTREGNESDDILALKPRYIAGPSALMTTILQVVNSIADPASSNASVYNPQYNNLIPVIEPLLDATSATAWYLFAEPTRVETVEVTFLQGQETPVTRNYIDNETLSRNYIILQTFAAKALDHRGIQKHNGA